MRFEVCNWLDLTLCVPVVGYIDDAHNATRELLYFLRSWICMHLVCASQKRRMKKKMKNNNIVCILSKIRFIHIIIKTYCVWNEQKNRLLIRRCRDEQKKKEHTLDSRLHLLVFVSWLDLPLTMTLATTRISSVTHSHTHTQTKKECEKNNHTPYQKRMNTTKNQ